MNPYDDNSVLGSYLSVFSTAGDVPTSLSGYGHGQRRHTQSLGGFGMAAPSPRLPSQPAATAAVTATTVKTTSLQNMLNALQVYTTKTGFYDAETDAAWNKYAKLFREPHSKIAPRIVDKLVDNKNIWISQQALGRLRDKALKTGRLREEAARPIGSKPKAAPTTPKTGVAPGSLRVSVDVLQKILIKLGQDPARITDGKYGPTTKAKYQAVAGARKLNTNIRGTEGAKVATVSSATYKALEAAAQSAGAPAVRPEDKRVVINTNEVQSILKRLGHPPERLSDGKTGTTTEGAWKDSATKRKLDPYIVKATADLRNVRVSERTFLMLKADADAKVSPDAAPKPPTLVSLPSTQTATVTGGELVSLLGLLGAPKPTSGEQVLAAWKQQAQKYKLDPRIEMAGDKLVVLRATWDRLQELAAPKEPAPGPKRDLLAEAVAKIMQQSTVAVKTSTLRQAFNAAIAEKRISRDPFPPTGPWKAEMRVLLLRWMGVQDGTPGWDAWAAALVKGRLVSADQLTVKLPQQVAQSLKDAAQKLAKAKAAAIERVKGFTQVNPAEVIARINNLGVSQKKFDRAGGAKELAQAISVFIAEAGGKNPTGEYVRTDKNDVYVKNDVLFALALAMKVADQRAAATKKFRDGMVSAALGSATKTVPVLTLQKAFKDAVLIQKTGTGAVSKRALDLYKRVTLSGAFDKPTRDAFTELARTATIGPSVQEFQRLLGAQKRYTTKEINARVVEIRNQVWNSYLDKAVKKVDGKLSVAMIPSLSSAVLQGAQRYDSNVAKESQQRELVAAQNKVLDDAVRKSTATLSLVAVQQGLKQMAGPEREKINPTGVKITGSSDKPTRDGLFQLSSMIFPEGYALPETMWVAYLKKVGKKVVSGAQMTPTWTGANYLSLPPALAQLLAKNAGDWIAKHGQSSIQVVAFRDPSVITVTVPKPKPKAVVFTEKEAAEKVKEKVQERAKEVVSAAAPVADAEAERVAREKAEAARRAAEAQQQARATAEAQRRAAQEAQAAQAAARQQEEARAAAAAQQAAAVRETQQAAGEAQAAQDVATQAGGAQVTGPTITGPTIQITTAAPEAPIQQAGMGVGPWLLGAAALGALLWPKGDKEAETR